MPDNSPEVTNAGARFNLLRSRTKMPRHYSVAESDRALLAAAAVLLKKVANAENLRPAELVSVAKLQHVLSRLPRVTPDLEVTVSVIGPRRKFGEIETWHLTSMKHAVLVFGPTEYAKEKPTGLPL
jgi:hypothetical protein